MLTELVCRPSNAAAMIAIGGRDKNHLLDGVCIFRLFQVGKADGIHVQPQLAADHAGQCVQTTKPLERIQTEPLGFVLDENCLDAQSLRHGIQPDQRCTLVTRQLLMDAVCGHCRLFRQKVRPFSQRLSFVLYDRDRTDFQFFRNDHLLNINIQYIGCRIILSQRGVICNILVEKSAICSVKQRCFCSGCKIACMIYGACLLRCFLVNLYWM